MLYRPYGKTGKQISIISAGGMRYANPDNIDDMAQIPLTAARLGVNYFDTAPYYCKDKSQTILGVALKQMRAEKLPYYTATKTGAATYDDVVRDIEKSLKIIDVDHIDFMHSWGINSFDIFNQRDKGGAFKAFLKAKEQGLISHFVCSSHMSGDDIAKLCATGLFEGILVGFSAINFPFRIKGIEGAHAQNMGVLTMNPLGGGVLMDHQERFSFIKSHPDQSILQAALHFNLSHPITAVVVGFRTVDDVNTAIATLDSFVPMTGPEIAKIHDNIENNFDQLCTTCNYCKECPQGISVCSFMESYNSYMLYKDPYQIFDRLRWHWGIESIDELNRCTSCGLCESVCTQKLPVMERFEEIKAFRAKRGT